MNKREKHDLTHFQSMMMDAQKIDRIYNRGDKANWPHFGTITAVSGKLGYEITPDEGSERTEPYWILPSMISPKFEGHSGTRIVPEAAYYAWRDESLTKMKKRFSELIESKKLATRINITAPVYDDVYYEALKRMNEEQEAPHE